MSFLDSGEQQEQAPGDPSRFSMGEFSCLIGVSDCFILLDGILIVFSLGVIKVPTSVTIFVSS